MLWSVFRRYVCVEGNLQPVDWVIVLVTLVVTIGTLLVVIDPGNFHFMELFENPR